MDEKKGLPPGQKMGFRDILSFILAAFSIILPYTLLAIAVLAVILLVMKLFV